MTPPSRPSICSLSENGTTLRLSKKGVLLVTSMAPSGGFEMRPRARPIPLTEEDSQRLWRLVDEAHIENLKERDSEDYVLVIELESEGGRSAVRLSRQTLEELPSIKRLRDAFFSVLRHAPS